MIVLIGSNDASVTFTFPFGVLESKSKVKATMQTMSKQMFPLLL